VQGLTLQQTTHTPHKAKQAEGDILLNFAMEIASQQLEHGRFFCFEHPDKATSWAHASVQGVAEHPGTTVVMFDQCRFGLRSPDSGLLMKKRTVLMTNNKNVVAAFSGKDF
jgi:hypothetical protein